MGLPLDTQVSRPQPGVVLLAVDGEVDTLTAARLQAGLTEAVDASRADGSGIVVDLSGVTFLASSGLAVLISGARRLAELADRLHLVAASRAVTRPLQVTGADALFDIHHDVASALAAAGPEGRPSGAAAFTAPPPGVAPPSGE
jgi:anti-sigma B factor antagonist